MQERLVMLVVDDVEVNRVSLHCMFEQEYHVLEAENGVQALDILRSRRVDVVILDVYMPLLDGAGVLGQMKADSSLRHIPVIVKTSVNENIEADMLERGADDFIFFPCDPVIIQNRVRNITQKYVAGQLMLKRQLEAERHRLSVWENFIDRIAEEAEQDADEILKLCQNNEKQADDVVYGQISLRAKHLRKRMEEARSDFGKEQERVAADGMTFRIADVVRDLEEEYGRMCSSKGIDFSMELFGESCGNLMGDSRYVKQIWGKMLEKAYYRTSVGEKIRTSCMQRRLGERRVELEITVQGRTDPKDHYPFVKSFVELLCGTMTVERKEESESICVIKLPFYIGKEPVAQKKRLNCLKAMVIDDDALTRDYNVSILNRLGVNCDTAVNGAAAVTSLRKAYAEGRGYDVCFVNWYMTGGRAFVQEVRSNYSREEMILVCSVNSGEEIQEEMKEAGVDYVLNRPVYQGSLYRFLRHICSDEGEDAVV